MTSGMCAGISLPARRPDHHFAKELEQLLRNLSINATYRKLPEKIQVSCQASAHTRTIKIWLSTFPRQGSGVVFGVEEWERHSKLVSTGLVRRWRTLAHQLVVRPRQCRTSRSSPPPSRNARLVSFGDLFQLRIRHIRCP